MKKPHYDIKITDLDLMLFTKCIESGNINTIVNIVLEQQLDIDSIYSICIEKKLTINENRYNKIKKKVETVLELMEAKR